LTLRKNADHHASWNFQGLCRNAADSHTRPDPWALQAGDELLPVAGGGFMTDSVDKPIRSEIVLYQTEDGKTRLEVRLENETVWLTQSQMAEPFQTSIPNVSMHIRNIFREVELQEDTVVKDFLTTAADGKSYRTKHFSLDVIISVGYRVKSHRGTQFRIWATQRLREYIIKGFTLDDDRLKQAGGGNYFDELLARIRDIRSSEKSSGARFSIRIQLSGNSG
jgi:hypothetical protein